MKIKITVALVVLALVIFLITSKIVYNSQTRVDTLKSDEAKSEPLWELPNGTKVYRNIDWLNNNVCYTTVWNFTSDMAISCVSMVK